jgi:FkbM family methyltransferase
MFIKDLARPIVRRFPTLMHRYRVMRDARYRSASPEQTPFGFKLTGNAQMIAGTFEPEETQIINKFLESCDVFVNIGANIGYYVCHAIARGRPAIAVEPHPSNVEFLLKNLRANAFEQLAEVHPVAVSDHKCVVELFGTGTGASLIPGWADSPKDSARLVFATKVDEIMGSRFVGKRCLVLMDVEGHEDAALEGAKSFLAQEPKPTWIVEIAIDEHRTGMNEQLMSTFSRFWDNGYAAWTCADTTRIVSRDEIEAIATTGKNTIETHNFIFVDKNAPLQ